MRVALGESLTYMAGDPPSITRLLRTILCDPATYNVLMGSAAAFSRVATCPAAA
jgi:hypothetical protein